MMVDNQDAINSNSTDIMENILCCETLAHEEKQQPVPSRALPVRQLSKTGQERRRLFLQAQQAAKERERVEQQRLLLNSSNPNSRRPVSAAATQLVGKGVKKLGKGVLKAGRALQKVNVAKWIDEMEQDQEKADELERINDANQSEHTRRMEEFAQEEERQQICAQAHHACMQAVSDHLQSFLKEHAENGVYEEWIMELHPDNVLEDDARSIDARFYVHDADHRLLWNQAIMDYYRNKKNQDDGAAGGMQRRLVAASTSPEQSN